MRQPSRHPGPPALPRPVLGRGAIVSSRQSRLDPDAAGMRTHSTYCTAPATRPSPGTTCANQRRFSPTPNFAASSTSPSRSRSRRDLALHIRRGTSGRHHPTTYGWRATDYSVRTALEGPANSVAGREAAITRNRHATPELLSEPFPDFVLTHADALYASVRLRGSTHQ
jgi:hypothetical protein